MILKNTSKHVLIALFLLCPAAASAQAYLRGQSVITLVYGFPDLFRFDLKKAGVDHEDLLGNFHTYSVKTQGPVFFKYEYAFSSRIGIGGLMAYRDANFIETINHQGIYQDVTKTHYTNIGLAMRAAYHFRSRKKFDPFMAISAGYSFLHTSSTYSTTGPYMFAGLPRGIRENDGILLSVTAGVKCYITQHIGIYAEGGFDRWAILQAGIAVKFG